MRQINLDLAAWGDWYVRHRDYSGLPSMEPVERYFFHPGRSETAGHKILCPEMPRRLQEVERAVDQLSPTERDAITLKHCAPLRVDGVVYTNRELAGKMGISKRAFEQLLYRGRNNVERLIYGNKKKSA